MGAQRAPRLMRMSAVCGRCMQALRHHTVCSAMWAVRGARWCWHAVFARRARVCAALSSPVALARRASRRCAVRRTCIARRDHANVCARTHMCARTCESVRLRAHTHSCACAHTREHPCAPTHVCVRAHTDTPVCAHVQRKRARASKEAGARAVMLYISIMQTYSSEVCLLCATSHPRMQQCIGAATVHRNVTWCGGRRHQLHVNVRCVSARMGRGAARWPCGCAHSMHA